MYSSGSVDGSFISGDVKSRAEKIMNNEGTPQVSIFTTKQNMDTPLITEQEEDTAAINSAYFEVDSD